MSTKTKHTKKSAGNKSFWFTLFTASTLMFALERAAHARAEEVMFDEAAPLDGDAPLPAVDIKSAQTGEEVTAVEVAQHVEPFVVGETDTSLLQEDKPNMAVFEDVVSDGNSGGGEIPLLPESEVMATEESSGSAIWLLGAAVVGIGIAIALGGGDDCPDDKREMTPPPQELPPSDYGDAPFQSTIEDPNGFASHAVVDVGPYLGIETPDIEADGKPSELADGDDSEIFDDDEDGLSGFGGTVSQGSNDPEPTFTNSIQIGTTGEGFFQGWIDQDQNGLFDADEALFVEGPVLTGSGGGFPGAAILTVTNTALFDAIRDDLLVQDEDPGSEQYYIRLRFASESEDVANPVNQMVDGTVDVPADGEVEDYCGIFSSGSLSFEICPTQILG